MKIYSVLLISLLFSCSGDSGVEIEDPSPSGAEGEDLSEGSGDLLSLVPKMATSRIGLWMAILGFSMPPIFGNS